MRKLFISFFLCAFCTQSFSQGLDGKYDNVYGEEIIISDGMLYLTQKGHKHNQVWWQQDTLATCVIRKINKSLLEVKTIDPNLHKTWSIESTYEKREDDSIKVVFTIPYQWDDLEIVVGTYPDFKDFKNKKHEKFVLIPRCKQYDFEIRPTERFAEHNIGVTYGRIRFYSTELSMEQFEIEENVNRIEIKIPKLDDYFFAKYHVYSDYIYVKDNELYWKGNVYKKVR